MWTTPLVAQPMPSPFRPQLRRIFQNAAKECSARVRTRRCEVSCRSCQTASRSDGGGAEGFGALVAVGGDGCVAADVLDAGLGICGAVVAGARQWPAETASMTRVSPLTRAWRGGAPAVLRRGGLPCGPGWAPACRSPRSPWGPEEIRAKPATQGRGVSPACCPRRRMSRRWSARTGLLGVITVHTSG